jgi:hypothetical protein
MADKYLLRSDDYVIRDDGATIPPDPANRDYAEYLDWVAAGNTAASFVPEFDATWLQYQNEARAALDSSDNTVIRCMENGVPVPADWKAYRAALRVIVGATSGDPTQPLPTRPAYPAGT